MYQVSSEFKQEILDGATIVTVVDIYMGDKYSPPVAENVPIDGGSITSDPEAAIRRRCELEINATDSPDIFIPSPQYRTNQVMWPSGNEVNIKQGIKYRNGSLGTEWVNLGWFTLSRPHVRDTGDELKVTVEGADFTRRIGRNKFVNEYYIAPNTFIPDAVKSVFNQILPGVEEKDYDFATAANINQSNGGITAVTPALTLQRNDNPWVKMANMCRWCGLDLDITVDRKIRLRPLPNPLWEDPVAVYEEGEYNIIEDLERVLDDDGAINGVVVIGENSSNPTIVRGECWDTNPFSPTYFDPANPGASKFGPNPKVISLNWVAQNDIAQLVAIYEFLKSQGIIETINFTGLPMFAHEPYDIVRIKRARAGIDGEYMIDSMSLGLGPNGSLQATTKQRERIHWGGSELS
jgi:hypothetical protein